MQRYSRKKFVAAIITLLGKYPQEHIVELMAAEIVAQRWTHQLDILFQELARELLRQEGVLRAHVTSARPLPKQLLLHLKKLLQERLTATTVELTTETAPALKGGVVVTTPAGTFDVSVASQINHLKQLA
ncbi:MAG: F0F1 ATP synthase subunit delta [Candidatus Andersenbacteria bacterium]